MSDENTKTVSPNRMPQRPQKRVSEEKEAQLSPDQVRRRTFERAIKLVTARPRSVAELRGLLLKVRAANNAVVEEAISRLREYGYLDDERFALSFASLKVRRKPVGRRRLARDLALKKVDQAVVEEALEQVYTEVSEDELIDRAIEKRIRLRGRPASRAEIKKLFDHLLRRGFPFELVTEKVRLVTRGGLDEFD